MISNIVFIFFRQPVINRLLFLSKTLTKIRNCAKIGLVLMLENQKNYVINAG